MTQNTVFFKELDW